LEIVCFAFIFPRETKVAQLDILVFVEEDVLQLQISMNAGLAVDICDGADELSEDLLYGIHRKWSILAQVVVELVA
jgi:hypothetical protein